MSAPTFTGAMQYGALGLLGVVIFAVVAIGLMAVRAHMRALERVGDAMEKIPASIRDSLRPVSEEITVARQELSDQMDAGRVELKAEIRDARCRYGRSPQPSRPGG